MSPNNSLKNLDVDLIFKNMIFAILYVSGILAFFSYILWPTILDFKAEYIVERKNKIIYNEAQKGFNASKDRLSSFLQENQPLLNRFNNANSYEIIHNISKRLFTKHTIKKISEQTNSQTQIKTIIYQITAQTPNIQNLWNFISELNKTSSSAIVNIPIRIQKPSEAKTYEIVFNIDIAQNTNIANPLIQNIIQEVIPQQKSKK